MVSPYPPMMAPTPPEQKLPKNLDGGNCTLNPKPYTELREQSLFVDAANRNLEAPSGYMECAWIKRYVQ